MKGGGGGEGFERGVGGGGGLRGVTKELRNGCDFSCS